MKKRIIYLLLFCVAAAPVFAAFDSRVMLNQGLEAFRSGNYSSAELLFRRTVEFDDENRDRAWFYLSRSIFQQGKYSAALFEFNTFLTKCRTEALRIESRFWMGESYFNLKQNLKAIEEYKRFLENSKDKSLTVLALDRIATIYYNQQRYEEAVIEWENAISESGDREQNAILILKIGQAYFANGEYDKAHDRLYPLITSRIDSKSKTEIRITLGQIYQHQDDHRKALTTFNAIPRELANKHPYYDMYYFRALSNLKLDRTAPAKADLELFYMIGKNSSYYYDALFELGKLIIDVYKSENGLEMLIKVREESDKPELAFKSAMIIGENLLDKDPEKTIKYTEKFRTIEDDQSKKDLYILLSKAYIKADRSSEAEVLLNEYASLYPFDLNIDEVNFFRARIYLEKGETDRAIQIFESIRRDNPFSKFLNESDYYLGVVHFKNKKFNESATYLKRYLSRKDAVISRYDAVLLLTEIYLLTGDLNAAENQIRILINQYISNKHIEQHLYRFAMMLNEKRPAAAQRYFNTILTRFPDSEYAMMVNIHYGNEAFAAGNYAKAIPFYEKFLNSNITRDSGVAFYNLIRSYYNLSEYKKVTDIIGKGQIPPLDEIQWREIPLIHARSYYQMNMYSDVYRVLKWEDITPLNDEDAFMFVESTIKTGDVINAESLIMNLKGRGPLYGRTLELLGQYYKNNNDYKKAENIFYEVISSTASDEIKNRSRIALAVILRDASNFTQSDFYLNQIEGASFIPDRDSLRIVNLFLSGNDKAGAEMTTRIIRQIQRSSFSEDVFKLNLLYYYNLKNTGQFNIYASLLEKNRDNTELVEYLSGRLAFDTANFNKSFTHFNKLSSTENVYKTEANYYLGMISLLLYKNRTSAIRFFTRATDDPNPRSEFVQRAKINLAVIYNENKNFALSRQFLSEIIDESTRGRYKIEAENLWHYYNY